MRRLPALLAALALTAGCGGDGGDGLLSAGGGLGSDPNAYDAEFARAMAANDERVGALVELGRDRARRRELRKIARSTVERLDAELPRLRQAAANLAERGVRPARPNPVPAGVDARELREAVSFDHEFMVMMIRAHEHAVAAAEVEQDRGGDPGVKRLAREVSEWRGRDLEQLRRWLNTWYGESTVPGDGGGGGEGGDDGGEGGGGDPDV